MLLLSVAKSSASDAQWLYGSFGYATLSSGNEVGVLLRLLQLAGGVAGTIAILALIPQHSLLISPIGTRSFSGYLLHGFQVKFALIAGLFGVVSALPDVLLLSLILMLTLACALALCAPLAQRPL